MYVYVCAYIYVYLKKKTHLKLPQFLKKFSTQREIMGVSHFYDFQNEVHTM